MKRNINKSYGDMILRSYHIKCLIILSMCMVCRLTAQTADNRPEALQTMEQYNAMLNKFSRKCERRTKKAERRFNRYERKLTKKNKETSEISNNEPVTQNPKPENSLGKEPLLDSLRLVYGFAEHTGTSSQSTKKNELSSGQKSLNRAQQQLNATQSAKSELLQRKEYWKAQANGDSKNGKWLSKMEKERYYYTAQINEYRKPLRDPSNMDDKLMSALRGDPRFADFAATLPAKPQNPAKMQPRQMVQEMMQTQATAIDADPTKLIQDAKTRGNEILGNLSAQSTSFGNIDNAAQMPKFTPNPYKTKSFWQRVDVGFNLQFDNRTRFMPSTGVAGAQAAFNFNPKFSVGVLADYRFGMGDIKNIRLSHAGADYGAFANYKILKMFGLQVGYERNWRVEMEMNEIQYPATWSNSALAGLTWEYGVGKKAKGTVGVFYDFMYKKHTPESNAVLWRMGWKM